MRADSDDQRAGGPAHACITCHILTNSIAGLDLTCNLWLVEGDMKKCSYSQRVLCACLLIFFSIPLDADVLSFANTPSLHVYSDWTPAEEPTDRL